MKFFKFLLFFFAILFVYFTSCDNNVEQSEPINFRKEDIARYTISTIMGQSSRSILSEKAGEYFVLTYIRSSDEEIFTYRVKFDENKIIWSGFIDGKWGRWRDSDLDDEITYEEIGDKLVITLLFSDGSSNVQEFKIGD
jgi:hypothetical protein